ncbi:MAG: hypothetical protein KI790_00965 [Cyclobacteriaceae bacterium]|nr:hypothetical protein [Cyclobacteriaceae bacterium HetDA_MAG_MS6]
MQTISILGCGWLGLPLGAELVRHGYYVKGSTRSKERAKVLYDNDIKAYVIDLIPLPAQPVQDFFECDVLVINMPPRNREGESDFHSNQLKYICSAVSSTAQVILVSSTGVYPSIGREILVNDADPNCVSRSGISLLEIEQLVRKYCSTTILRAAGLIGPGRHPGRFFTSGKVVKGADQPVNLIHQQDIIYAIIAIIKQNQWRKTFHLAAPNHPTKKDFYLKSAKSLNRPEPKFDLEESNGFKIINPTQFVEATDFSFRYPDLMSALDEKEAWV